jgi:hypothetical protein
VIESSGHANRGGRRMSELKLNRNEFGTDAVAVAVIMVTLHNYQLMSFWRNLFAEHLCHEENDDGSEKAASAKKIYEGVTRAAANMGIAIRAIIKSVIMGNDPASGQ